MTRKAKPVTYEEEKRKAWEEQFGYDDDPLVEWEEFKDSYTKCSLCDGWDDGPCICYAR